MNDQMRKTQNMKCKYNTTLSNGLNNYRNNCMKKSSS